MSILAKVTPTKLIFPAPDSTFKIYSCKTNNPEIKTHEVYNNFTIKGDMSELVLDKEYEMDLEEVVDKQGRRGYQVLKIHHKIITTADEQFDFLETILTKKQAKAFKDAYGYDPNILKRIANGNVDISKLKGIGTKSLVPIREKVSRQMEFQKAFVYLRKFDVTEDAILKMIQHYKDAETLIEVIKTNPYQLISIHGFGFKKADAIALSAGYDRAGEFRVMAGIAFALNAEGSIGHTYVEKEELINKASVLLEIQYKDVEVHLQSNDNVLVLEDGRATLKNNYYAEKTVAKKLIKVLSDSEGLDYDHTEAIRIAEKTNEIKLSDKQKQLFDNARKYPVNILEGYAGTGKSKTIESFLLALKEMDMEFLLVSPSAIAAKVLTNYTGEQAFTIHRIIAQFERVGLNHVEYLIIDECGMVDIKLLRNLLILCGHPNLKILFIGDPFQLPSIGEGNVLYDLIHSGVIPKVLLDEVFRQQEGGMLDVITKVRQGEKFLNDNDWGIKEYGKDCVMACVPKHKLFDGIIHYFNKEMLNYSSDDITVTIPTKKNAFGTVNVNDSIQEIVNPEDMSKEDIQVGGTTFRVGDLIINTVNSYDTEDMKGKFHDIVNGDVGKIIEIDKEAETFIIDFEFTKVEFKFEYFSKLMHFWASTIHKMQGNSNKVVIVVLDSSHKFQLSANLVYTAMTRPEERLIVLCQAETLNFAMKKRVELTRNTFLIEMLKDEYEKTMIES